MDTLTYIIIGIVILIVILFLIMMNKLIKAKNRAEESFSTMDVYLKKRWDLIPNLVETVKGYASHEKKTLEEVILLRNKTYSTMDECKKMNVDNELEPRIQKLMALTESYPELKASEPFLNLSQKLRDCEEGIANSRKYYNACIKKYNDLVEMFPTNVIAKLLKFKRRENYSITAAERENAKIDL